MWHETISCHLQSLHVELLVVLTAGDDQVVVEVVVATVVVVLGVVRELVDAQSLHVLTDELSPRRSTAERAGANNENRTIDFEEAI